MEKINASFLRLSVITGIFIVNFMCLLRMFCCASRMNHCVHTISTGLILLCTMTYLSSWLPYLFHSFINKTVWPIMEIQDHCIIQHTVCGQLTTILLAILCVRKLYDAFSPSRAKTLSYAACIAWIIPQLVYLTMAEILNSEDSGSYQFLDRVVQQTASSRGENYLNLMGSDLSPQQPPHLFPTKLHPNDNGFMICVHKLTSAIVAQLSWHYVVLVIPLTALLLMCLAADYIKHSFKIKSKTDQSCDSCSCSTDIILSFFLYLNFAWLLLFRPLIVLHTLISQKEDDIVNDGNQLHSNLMDKIYYQKHHFWQKSAYLDFGTHIILLLYAILIPFSSQGGFRTDMNERLKMKHIQKARKLLASQFTSVKTIASSCGLSHFDDHADGMTDQDVRYYANYAASNCASSNSSAKGTKVSDAYDVSRIHCE